jgi:hypothetical protein
VKNVKKNYKRVQAYNPALQYNSWQPEAYGTNIFSRGAMTAARACLFYYTVLILRQEFIILIT